MPGPTVSPEAHYKLLSGAIHSQCGSESLGDICLPAHNECSTGQTAICHRSREAGGVREIEGATVHFETAFVYQMLRCRCDSIRLDRRLCC